MKGAWDRRRLAGPTGEDEKRQMTTPDEWQRARDLLPALVEALQEMPVVVLTGLRQAGKSTLLLHEPDLAARRYVTLDDYAQLESARHAPDTLLNDPAPLTIDEAQRFPELLVSIKRAVDRDRRPGRFILSGSANLVLLRDVSESLAGRAIYLELHPFTRRELRRELRGGSVAVPFLRRLFDSATLPLEGVVEPITDEEILDGGFPPVCLGEVHNRELWFRGYVQTYLERDLRDLAQVRDLGAFRRLMVLAALRTGQILKLSEIARDAKLDATTTGRHLDLLETGFVLWRLPPFLGSRTSRVIKSPKLYFGDSGLACHLAGITRLGADDPMRGPLFETYVAGNLAGILSSRWPEARLHYWGVQGRHEVDFVIESRRECLAVEVISSERWDDRDLAHLRAFLADTPGCRAAVLAYNGTTAVALGDRLWAIPVSSVLS